MNFENLKNSMNDMAEAKLDSVNHGKIYDDLHVDDFAEESPDQDNKKPKILDVYFVKLKYEKGEDKVLEDEKKKNKTIKTQKISYEKISERGLSYQAALIVETENLKGKKITVKIKSGKEEVLTKVDEAVKFIDMADIEAVEDVAKYKDVSAKDSFEIEVGALSNDEKIENNSDFENMAILKLMLNQKAGDLSFDMAKKIIGLELKEGEEFEYDNNKEEDKDKYKDKAACLYVEIDCSEPEIEHSGTGEKNNQYLNNEDEYFRIKYLEQPWIIKARIEYENKITQSANSKRVIEYHQVNRGYKPSSASSSWCASFVGWCLSKTGFKAQLDAGAFAYGRTNTRNRNKKKTKIVDGKTEYVTTKDEKGNTVYVTEDIFEDPIWAQKLSDTSLGAICYVKTEYKGNEYDHVTFSVAKRYDGKILFLGGNQGKAVKLGCYSKIISRVYPIDYIIRKEDSELPIYYNNVPLGGSVTAS